MSFPQGAQPDMSIQIQSSTDNTQSPSIPLSAFGKTISASEFTTLVIDFNSLPGTGAQLVRDGFCFYKSVC